MALAWSWWKIGMHPSQLKIAGAFFQWIFNSTASKSSYLFWPYCWPPRLFWSRCHNAPSTRHRTPMWNSLNTRFLPTRSILKQRNDAAITPDPCKTNPIVARFVINWFYCYQYDRLVIYHRLYYSYCCNFDNGLFCVLNSRFFCIKGLTSIHIEVGFLSL